MFFTRNFPTIVINHFAACSAHSLRSDEYFNWSENGYRWDMGVTWDLWVLAFRKKGIEHVAQVLKTMDKKTIDGSISQFYTQSLDELAKLTKDPDSFLRFYVKIGELGFSYFPNHQLKAAASFQGVERCIHRDYVPLFRNIVKAKLGLEHD